MDMKKKVQDIYQMDISKQEKCKLLNDILIDAFNEMEAQDQNMHPEIHNNLSEAYRLAKDYLRELEES
jgi:hypothetical protein